MSSTPERSAPQEAQRARELAQALAHVRERIARAAHDCGRSSDQVHLVAVTKFFPASDVRLLCGMGVRDIGENRDQEAKSKIAQLAATGEPLPRVHFIGQAQSNKAASIASYADVVESVDRPKIVHALERACATRDRMLDVLVQVDLADTGVRGGPGGRGGVRASEFFDLAELVQTSAHLQLRGLMSVAPLGADPQEAFTQLAQLSCQLRQRYPRADLLSAGMSADLEAAISAGATHVRVGSAILGSRNAAR